MAVTPGSMYAYGYSLKGSISCGANVYSHATADCTDTSPWSRSGCCNGPSDASQGW